MLNLFKAWSRRRELARRDIFVYSDGVRERRVDPWDAWLKLWSDPQVDFKTVHPACARGEPDAQRQIEGLVCRVFDVQPYNADAGTGMTLLELHALLNRFTQYILDLKKKLDFSPTGLPRTASRSSQALSTTPPEPDSSSIGDASTSSVPSSS